MALQGFVKRSWTVMVDDAGSRLDAFLRAQLPFLSRRELDDALRQSWFTANGRPARKGYRVAEGDVVQFSGPVAKLCTAPVPNLKLDVPIVYEDASLIALDKPAGMDCHGFSGGDQETLANFLLARWPELVGIGKNRWEAGLVHRIDRDTSGLVLAARSQAVFDEMRLQFRRRKVVKIYFALVWGSTDIEGAIAFALAHDPRDRRKMAATVAPGRNAPDQKKWPALTRYRKLAEQNGMSFLKLEMETGVTHQLRVHLATIGHPIVGDTLYGAEARENFGLCRHFLHAGELRFVHPVLRRPTALKAPLPGELMRVIERLTIRLDAI